METPVSAQKVGHLDSDETKGECEQSVSTTLDVGGLCLVSEEGSGAVLDSGAAADLVCFR